MPRRIVVAVVTVLAVAMLVLGTLDTLVWLPQHLAPGIPLDRIYAVLSGTGDLPFAVSYAVVWTGCWALATGLYAMLLLPVTRAFLPFAEAVRPVLAATLGAALIGAMGFLHWWSAFSMAMSVSDELPPGVGGVTPLGAVLELGGVLVGLAGVPLLPVTTATRRRPRTAVAPEPCGQRRTPRRRVP